VIDPVAHLISLGYIQRRAQQVVAELLQGRDPNCPKCGIYVEVTAAAEPWSDEHLTCPVCHSTWCDASAVDL
jgi:hypothetical protein